MRVLESVILVTWIVSLAGTILNLLLVPWLKPRLPRRTPLVSVIVPARDEERAIERTVRALLAQTYPALEVIVVNDRSTDETESLLNRVAAEDARLGVIHGEDPPEGWLGKPWALQQGQLRARGELLLFVDADVIYEPDAIAAAVTAMDDRDVAMLSLMPHIAMRGFWEHVVMPNLGVFAFTFLPLWIGNRTRIPWLAVGGGPGNLVLREPYRAVGGHEALKDAVVDDVALARLFRRSGHRTEIVIANELVSVRMYHGLSEIVAGFTKNAFAVFDRSYVAGVFFLASAVVFHLLPYVLALWGHPLAIASVVLITLRRLVLFVSLRYRIDNALFGHPLMIGTWCFILLRSMWLTGIRRQLHWRGRMYDASRTRFGAHRD
jgi:chlorobactene glucosyltransferase